MSSIFSSRRADARLLSTLAFGLSTCALLAGTAPTLAQASKPRGAPNTPSPAGAAEAAATLDEISVEGAQPTFGTTGVVATRSTAGTRGNTSIAETPATVSVITREELDIRGVQNIETATAYTPGIYATDYPGGQGAPAFTLRGFRTLNFENVYEDGLRPGSAFSTERHYTVLLVGPLGLQKRLFEIALVDAADARVVELAVLPWYLVVTYLVVTQISQPLHFGDYGGLPLKLFWAGCAWLALFVTANGAWLWWARRPRRRSRPA